MLKRSEIPTTDPTRYEVAVFSRDGKTKVTAGFTARHTKSVILKMGSIEFAQRVEQNFPGIIFDENPKWCPNWQAFEIAPDIFFGFTGMTERSCAI